MLSWKVRGRLLCGASGFCIRRLLSRQPPRFTIFLHQFTDAAPGAFLDFGSLGGKDSYSFARKP
jgi:hypothetical protein